MGSEGKILASVSGDGSVKIWDLEQQTEMASFSGGFGRALSVAISPDNQTVAAGGEDGSIKAWDLTSGSLIKTFQGHTAQVNDLSFNPVDRKMLASASHDGTVRV